MICPQTVINQNQTTIDCIHAQDYCSAVISSTSALQYHGSIKARHRELHQTSSYDQFMLLTNTDEGDETDSNDYFIYDHGIPLPTTATDTGSITPILIFNAALAHQLLARYYNNEKSLLYLRRAHQLYALTYRSSGIDKNPLFQFAVINNAAVIERQFGNVELWNASMDYLLSLYMTLMDRGCVSILRHVQGFLSNAMPASPVAHVA